MLLDDSSGSPLAHTGKGTFVELSPIVTLNVFMWRADISAVDYGSRGRTVYQSGLTLGRPANIHLLFQYVGLLLRLLCCAAEPYRIQFVSNRRT